MKNVAWRRVLAAYAGLSILMGAMVIPMGAWVLPPSSPAPTAEEMPLLPLIALGEPREMHCADVLECFHLEAMRTCGHQRYELIQEPVKAWTDTGEELRQFLIACRPLFSDNVSRVALIRIDNN